MQIVTGNLRGAGTIAPATIQLIGTHGATHRFALGDSDSELFVRGSNLAFDLPVSEVRQDDSLQHYQCIMLAWIGYLPTGKHRSAGYSW